MWMRPCLEIGYAKPDFTFDEVDNDGETGRFYSVGWIIIIGAIVISMAAVGLKAYSGSVRSANPGGGTGGGGGGTGGGGTGDE